jgi:hypothetical protein
MADAKKNNPSFGKISPEEIERARAQIGVPQYERNPPHVSVATTDTMSHYAFGMGDDNPLWHDPEYGKTTRWRSQIALPCWQIYDRRRMDVLPANHARRRHLSADGAT